MFLSYKYICVSVVFLFLKKVVRNIYIYIYISHSSIAQLVMHWPFTILFFSLCMTANNNLLYRLYRAGSWTELIFLILKKISNFKKVRKFWNINY